jgi:hypothetical protein
MAGDNSPAIHMHGSRAVRVYDLRSHELNSIHIDLLREETSPESLAKRVQFLRRKLPMGWNSRSARGCRSSSLMECQRPAARSRPTLCPA